MNLEEKIWLCQSDERKIFKITIKKGKLGKIIYNYG